MSMQVKRIRELINSGNIKVHDPSKGFTVRDLAEGYTGDKDGCSTDSVFGYNGKLNIRPSYQRNSVYNEQKRNAVIQTVLDECPLNVMYWVDKEDGTFEVLDGQQRILSLVEFVSGNYAIESDKFPSSASQQDFPNLQMNLTDLTEQILDYELDIYVCKGTPSEKLKWFHVINTSGEQLNEQELRNSSYTGKWLYDAKQYFSTAKGRGVNLADFNQSTGRSEPLLRGSWNRQEYLQTALLWAGQHEGYTGDDRTVIAQYMAAHRGDEDASELWQYFSQVLEWARSKFLAYNSALKGMNWGSIYEAYRAGEYDNNVIKKSGQQINDEIVRLMADDEVTAKMKGIYQYIIYGDGKYLSIRQFDEKTARLAYEKQHHHCPYCEKEGNMREYAFKEMHADHIMPWSKGGKTVEENCQMLCKRHNESKGSKW